MTTALLTVKVAYMAFLLIILHRRPAVPLQLPQRLAPHPPSYNIPFKVFSGHFLNHHKSIRKLLIHYTPQHNVFLMRVIDIWTALE